MNRIVNKRRLSENVWQMDVEAPFIARARRAGQFVLVQLDTENGERIPLTIADADPETGRITLIFQAVGVTTMKLAKLEAGDCVAGILGPLGKPTTIRGEKGTKPGYVVCVGGGVGVAPVHPIAQALKRAGNRVVVIMGARSKDLFVMEDEMRRAADELILITDDGSNGRQGLVTDPLEELCSRSTPPDEIIAIGPPVMMRACARVAEHHNVKITVSLNTLMIDGTGMCGGCRVTVGGETKFVCVDGPEFDGSAVDWDMMTKRMKTFKAEEDHARDHVCKIGLAK